MKQSTQHNYREEVAKTLLVHAEELVSERTYFPNKNQGRFEYLFDRLWRVISTFPLSIREAYGDKAREVGQKAEDLFVRHISF